MSERLSNLWAQTAILTNSYEAKLFEDLEKNPNVVYDLNSGRNYTVLTGISVIAKRLIHLLHMLFSSNYENVFNERCLTIQFAKNLQSSIEEQVNKFPSDDRVNQYKEKYNLEKQIAENQKQIDEKNQQKTQIENQKNESKITENYEAKEKELTDLQILQKDLEIYAKKERYQTISTRIGGKYRNNDAEKKFVEEYEAAKDANALLYQDAYSRLTEQKFNFKVMSEKTKTLPEEINTCEQAFTNLKKEKTALDAQVKEIEEAIKELTEKNKGLKAKLESGSTAVKSANVAAPVLGVDNNQPANEAPVAQENQEIQMERQPTHVAINGGTKAEMINAMRITSPTVANLWEKLFTKFESEGEKIYFKSFSLDEQGNFTLELMEPLKLWMPPDKTLPEEMKDPNGGYVVIIGKEDKKSQTVKVVGKLGAENSNTISFKTGLESYLHDGKAFWWYHIYAEMSEIKVDENNHFITRTSIDLERADMPVWAAEKAGLRVEQKYAYKTLDKTYEQTEAAWIEYGKVLEFNNGDEKKFIEEVEKGKINLNEQTKKVSRKNSAFEETGKGKIFLPKKK